jgi:malic enzyme
MLVAATHALADVAATGQLLPDPLDATVHERVSQAVQAAGAAQVDLAADLRNIPRLPDKADPRPEAT